MTRDQLWFSDASLDTLDAVNMALSFFGCIVGTLSVLSCPKNTHTLCKDMNPSPIRTGDGARANVFAASVPAEMHASVSSVVASPTRSARAKFG